MGVKEEIREMARRARETSRRIAHLDSGTKNRALKKIAAALLDQKKGLQAENETGPGRRRKRRGSRGPCWIG